MRMNKNKLVLKASAGTGKTFRLSLEYIVALLNGMDYKNILVMTFTKKATAEIKKEVLDKICDFTKIYEILKEKKQDIEAIREYLKTEKEKYFLIIKVIEDLYGKKITENELKKLSIIYSEILKNKEKIKIYTIDSFLNIIFKNIVVNFLNIKTYTMIDDDENIYYYKKILENIFRDKDLFRRFKDFFIDNSEKTVDKYLEIIASLINGRWKYLISLSENENFYSKEKLTIEKPSHEYLKDICIYIQDEAKKELEDSLKKDYKKYLNKSDDVLRKMLSLDFKNILDNEPYNGNKFRKKEDSVHKEEIKNIYEKLKRSLSKEIYNEILIPYEKNLIDLSSEIYKIYDELKIRERKFTFNDISLYTYRVLFNSENKLMNKDGLTENFFESLDMQIDTIFIDEFQDTSILQWKILYEIIKKASSVICVGDEKQSIYGWRGGEKKLFENLEKIIGAREENMDISYRSDINIVEFTNKIFNKIKEKAPNWKYKESNANSKEKGYVKLNYVEKNKDEKINIVQVLIEELEKTGLKNYSDIAIIARTNKELKEIAEALEEKKIPYHLSTKRNIEDSRGIFEYLELLKYLIYDRKLSLFNFLASDLTFLGTEEIEFLLKNKDKTFNYLDDLKENEFKNLLPLKVQKILDKIKFLKREYKILNAQDLTKKIYDEFNFFHVFTKENELKNLSEIYLLTKKYNSSFAFLRAFENADIEISENLIQNSAIELMTIHKSKGLQFKTVLVLQKLENKKNKEMDFIFLMDKEYKKVKFSLFVKNGYTKIIENCFVEEMKEIRQSQEEEEINNFYVAVTRAKNNLIVVTENPEYFESLEEFQSLKNFEIGKLKFFEADEEKDIQEKKYRLKDKNNLIKEKENFEIGGTKFLLKTEEQRVLGILIHYFLENIRNAEDKEIEYAKKLCYKNYLSYFGEEKLSKIFSEKNIKKILEISGEIFSEKWDHIYSEYEIYDYENKKSYRIDRIMIKDDDGNGNGEIYIVDYKTGSKNDEQIENYKNLIYKNFGDEVQNYKVRTKFLEFDIEY